jgi:hypothetical protein
MLPEIQQNIINKMLHNDDDTLIAENAKILRSVSTASRDLVDAAMVNSAQTTRNSRDPSIVIPMLICYLIEKKYNLFKASLGYVYLDRYKVLIEDTTTLTIGSQTITILFKSKFAGVLTSQCVVTLTSNELCQVFEFDVDDEVVYRHKQIPTDTSRMYLFHKRQPNMTSEFFVHFSLLLLRNKKTINLKVIITCMQSNSVGEQEENTFMDTRHVNMLFDYEFQCSSTNKVSTLEKMTSFFSIKTLQTPKCDVSRLIMRFIFLIRDSNILGLDLQVPVFLPSESILENIEIPLLTERAILDIPVLGHVNAMLMHEYAIKTGRRSVFLMQYYNNYLGSDHGTIELKQKQKQKQIYNTLIAWRKCHYAQPMFTRKVAGHFQRLPSNDTTNRETTLQSCDSFGVSSAVELNALQVELLTPLMHTWIAGSMASASSEDLDLVEVTAFEVYPLLPLPLPLDGARGGNYKTQPMYTRTKTRIYHKQNTHTVYTGKRGGRYIFVNQQYISLNKLK